MKATSKEHTLTKPKVGRLSVTKRKRGINALTAVEEANKTRQELHTDIKDCYAVQTVNGIKYLKPGKYDTLIKLAAFKAKNPGSYMKNDLNGMRKIYDTLNNEEPVSLPEFVQYSERRKYANVDFTRI